MRSAIGIFVVLFLVCSSGFAADDGFTPLFNGKDLTGWKVPQPNPFWTVKDGVLVGENDPAKKGSMLWTEKSFTDFILETDVRWSGEIDSGIMLRKAKPPTKGDVQVQIGISRSLKKEMTCCLYIYGKYPEPAQAKGAQDVLKVGDWNSIRIQAKGANFKIWLNGKQVLDYDDANFPNAGPIGVQIHGGLAMKVEFRNIRIKPLD